jgi:hypothetical protein
MSTNKLSERAMLVTLTRSRWMATRTDRQVTEEVAKDHGVKARRAGHYRKHVIDIDAPTFKAVTAAYSKIRDRHLWYTLPWQQDGARILPAANFEKYSAEMRHLRQEAEIAVEAFVADYPRLREAAKSELNGLYNPKDYPTNIKAKFAVDVAVMPLPEAEDFRATLSEQDVAQIKAGITEELAKTTAAAMRDPYQRLIERIESLAKLADPKAPVYDSYITGLRDICEILPSLNLTADPQLEELRMRAQGLIVDAQVLRDMPAVRADVAKRATEIQDAMAAFMGVPSHE